MAEGAQLKEILSQSGMGARQDSEPNVRQPRMKQNSEKQKEMKARLAHWVTKRPGTVGQKPPPRRTLSDQDLSTHKRMYIQNQQSGWSKYYSSTLGSHSKISAESRCNSAPPKPAIKHNSGSGKPYNPVAKGEDGSVANRGRHLQASQAQRHSAFSRFGGNKRLTLGDLEKKRFQTIAEYQFMTPGKTFYYCTRESVKQRLRSIYLAHQPGQKPPKSAFQTNWPPVCCQERPRTRVRRNPLTGATGEFLGDISSLRTSPMPHGMMELAHKVSKLALVSERPHVNEENSPKRRAVNRSHGQPQPSTEKPVLSADELQLSSVTEGKESKEQAVEQEFSVNTLPRGSGIKTLQALKAVEEIINKGRGASGRDHAVATLQKKPGLGNSQTLKNIIGLSCRMDSADREDTAEDLLTLPQSSNCPDPGVAHDSKDSAIIIPMLAHPLTPDESTDTDLLSNVRSSNSELAESPAGEKGQASHPRTVRPSDLSFTCSIPKHYISMGKSYECSISPSATLQRPSEPENGKEVFCSMDNLAVPFPRKCLGTEFLFSLSDDDDDDDE